MKKKSKGAVLVELVLCVTINVSMVFGALEMGWFLYTKQVLISAAMQASLAPTKQLASAMFQNYLTGSGFSDTFVKATTISYSTVNLKNPSSKTTKITASVPKSRALLLGGFYSQLSSINASKLTVSAYSRVNDITYKGNSSHKNR